MAGRVTIGLALQWPCITDLSSLSTYRLNGLVRETSTPPTLCKALDRLYLFTAVGITSGTGFHGPDVLSIAEPTVSKH